MDINEGFWERQYKDYSEQQYLPEIKYESWQPGRWAANRAAVKILLPYINSIEDACEVGAGSAAFSFELKKQLDINISGIDLCENARKYACKIANDMKLPINYLVGDLFKTYYCSDLILSLGVIEHFDEDLQMRFLRRCYEMSNKYVLISIPNQESIIFRNYVNWADKDTQAYEEGHKPLTTEKLADMMKQIGMKIVHIDGFQVFLSELKFWNETDINSISLYQKIKRNFVKNEDKWKYFPCFDFTYDDISKMVEIETSLSIDERLLNGFMTYVLAEK